MTDVTDCLTFKMLFAKNKKEKNGDLDKPRLKSPLIQYSPNHDSSIFPDALRFTCIYICIVCL